MSIVTCIVSKHHSELSGFAPLALFIEEFGGGDSVKPSASYLLLINWAMWKSLKQPTIVVFFYFQNTFYLISYNYRNFQLPLKSHDSAKRSRQFIFWPKTYPTIGTWCLCLPLSSWWNYGSCESCTKKKEKELN